MNRCVNGDNKGFSLVELIIVIAIMAILVGVMAPQLIKYIEKTNVSSDTQLLDTVHEAMIVAMSDPAVLSAGDKSKEMIDDFINPEYETAHIINTYASDDWLECEFAKSVTETVGFNPFDINADYSQYFKSTPASGHTMGIMTVHQPGSTAFALYLQWSDRTGKKDGESYTGDYDGLEDSKVIYVK